MAANITDLPKEVLSRIFTFVAKSMDGAHDIVVSMATCQLFLEASNIDAIHKAACFRNVQVLGRFHLFSSTNGLLYKSIEACNPSVEYLLAQVILATSSHMARHKITKEMLNFFHPYSPKYKNRLHKAGEDTIVASFMARFTPAPGADLNCSSRFNPNPSTRPLSFHWEFVKMFILKCTSDDIRHMYMHFYDYVGVFLGHSVPPILSPFFYRISMLISIANLNEDEVLVRTNGNHFVMFKRSFVPHGHGEVIEWGQKGAVFEEVRAIALEAFDVIIQKLG